MPLDNTNDLIEDLNNLGDSNDIKTLWEDITGNTTGTITVYQRQSPYETEIIPINLDKWMLGENALVVPFKNTSQGWRPVDEGAVKDANGKVVLADIDANGDYVLLIGYDEFDDPIPPATPLVGNYALIWQIKGDARDTFIIPTLKEVKDFDSDPALIQDGNQIIPAKNGSFVNAENLNDVSTTGSGVVSGMRISRNAGDSAKLDIASGIYKIVDNYTDRANPTFTYIEFAGVIGLSLTYLAVAPVTFLGMDKDQNIIQQFTPISSVDERDYATIGGASHINNTIIDRTGSFGNEIGDQGLGTPDTLSCIGTRVNCEGNDFSANGANLKIDKSIGRMMGAGINYDQSDKSVNLKEIVQLSPATFLLTQRTVGLSILTEVSDIPTDKYDPNGDGVLVDIPDGFFTTLRILIVPEFEKIGETDKGTIFVQYGEFVYDNMKLAIDSFESEEYQYAPELDGVHTRSILTVKQGATDLSDPTQAKFSNLGALGARDFKRTPSYARFSNPNVVSGMTNSRQAITYTESGGVLYAEFAKEFNFERDDISFATSDDSINTVDGDFDVEALVVGDKIVVSGTTNNNGIYEVATIAEKKITVVENFTDEGAGNDVKIETPGKGDIQINLEGRWYILDCTTGDGINGRARIALTHGTDPAPQENWVWVIKSGDIAILQQGTSEPVKGAFSIFVSTFTPSVTTTIAEGHYNSRRWTDTKQVDGRGALATVLCKLRDLSPYKSGLAGDITIDSGPNPDEIDFTIDSGIVREIYRQIVNNLILSVNGALVINDSVTPYKKITDLNEIILDANGDTLNNKNFQLIIAVSLNADGDPDRLLINLPNDSYISGEDAFKDIKNTSITTFPSGFKSVYLLFAAVLKITGGAVWTNIAISEGGVNNIDLRGSELGTGTGGTGSVSVAHNDTTGKQGGTTDEYYHLTNAHHTNLTGGNPVFTTVQMGNILGGGNILSATNDDGISLYDNAGNGLDILDGGKGVFSHDLDVTGELTASTIDAGNGNIIVDYAKVTIDGTKNSIDGPHIACFVADYIGTPLLHMVVRDRDDVGIYFDSYWTGVQERSADFGSNFKIHKHNNVLGFYYDSEVGAGAELTWKLGAFMDALGNFNFNQYVLGDKGITGLGDIEGFVVKYLDGEGGDETVVITSGYCEANGIYYELTSDTTYDLTVLASAFGFVYIYIDESESTSPTPTFIDSLTPPTWSEAKQGLYNGNDRYIGAVASTDGASTINHFDTTVHSGRTIEYQYGVSKLPQMASNMSPTGNYQTPDDNDGSAVTPVGASKLFFKIQNTDGGTAIFLYASSAEKAAINPAVANAEFFSWEFHNAGIMGYVSLGATRNIKIAGADNDDNLLNLHPTGFLINR